jgi:preprotein translocase subunit SecA
MSFLTRIFGDPNEREVRKLRPLVERINALEPECERLSDEELRARTAAFKERLAGKDEEEQAEILDQILPEAFALVREAAKRTIGQRHYDVQLIGGIVLHQGKIAEMKTGEGKTLVATLPTYLNALTGRGVHVVTVNDYLARRDCQWMGRIYDLLGLSVGVLQHDAAYLFTREPVSQVPNMEHLAGPVPRRQVYEADILYGTNHEFGFDYLRDNMATALEYTVQRPLYYAIVDEVDNILIDEARTPLIISGPAEENTRIYQIFAQIVPQLRPQDDYNVELRTRSVTLTESGVEKVEGALSRVGVLKPGTSIYAPENYRLTRFLEAALKAHVIYQRDRDYVVKDGEVIIVDDFTGRLMFGRRWSDGLHQAVEAKERVRIQQESITYATITLQNYFRLYHKLAGMTGTAATEAEEFHKIYKLDVIVIPTHRPMIREDHPDLVYRTARGKYDAVVEEVEECHRRGQPVLVGTVSIENSEYLSELLRRKGIPHQVLNAKHHEREAMIVAEAGRLGAVTIATNMAGRGTDIILGGNPEARFRALCRAAGLDPETGEPEKLEELRAQAQREWEEEHNQVVALGGLHIIGTERHESRRIDNQLRGRSGRQGDPGSSRFYVSFEDDLMKRFAPDWLPGMMSKLGMDDQTPIEHAWVTKALQSAQVKVEGHNFDIRKHVVEYDDVMNLHRDRIYGDRRKILSGADLKANILDMIAQDVRGLMDTYCADRAAELWDIEALWNEVNAIAPLPRELAVDKLRRLGREELEERLLTFLREEYDRREREMGVDAQGEPRMRTLERLIMLKTIDDLWVQHLTEMEAMREGIGLRAYGQIDPLVAYKREAYDMFEQLQRMIRNQITHTIYHVQLREAPPPPPPLIADPARLRTNVDESDGTPLPAGGNGRGAGGRTATGMRKVGRNEPCPCGSGKKYKRCHGAAATV